MVATQHPCVPIFVQNLLLTLLYQSASVAVARMRCLLASWMDLTVTSASSVRPLAVHWHPNSVATPGRTRRKVPRSSPSGQCVSMGHLLVPHRLSSLPPSMPCLLVP